MTKYDPKPVPYEFSSFCSEMFHADIPIAARPFIGNLGTPEQIFVMSRRTGKTNMVKQLWKKATYYSEALFYGISPDELEYFQIPMFRPAKLVPKYLAPIANSTKALAYLKYGVVT